MLVHSGPRRGLNAVAVSPDGTEVAACGYGPLHVWRAGRRREVVPDGACDVAYTPDGRWLLYRRFDFAPARADEPQLAAGGEYALDRTGEFPPHRLAGGHHLAAAGDRLILRDDAERAVRCLRVTARPPFPELWRVPAGEQEVAQGAAVLPGGRVLLTGWRHGVGRFARLLDAATGAVRASLPDSLTGLAAASTGGRIIGYGRSRFLVWAADRLDAPPGELPAGRRATRELVWHPSGAYVLGVQPDDAVYRPDPDSGRLDLAFRPPGGKATAVAVAPDGLTAAVGTSQGRVVVFDLD